MCEIRDKLEAKQEVIFEYESERKDFMTYEIMLAEGSEVAKTQLIDNRGEIVVNQNCGMRLRILLQNLGFKVNFINKQCFLKLAQDFPV